MRQDGVPLGSKSASNRVTGCDGLFIAYQQSIVHGIKVVLAKKTAPESRLSGYVRLPTPRVVRVLGGI